MSYSVSGSGHGADHEKVKAAFAEFVAALDAATDMDAPPADGWASPSLFQGSVSLGQADGSFHLTADQVRSEVSPDADTGETEPDPENT